VKRKPLGVGWYAAFLIVGCIQAYRGFQGISNDGDTLPYLQFIIGTLMILGASFQMYKSLKGSPDT
jgi:uncharacterized membrane protein YtjA (UPF0391 family)